MPGSATWPVTINGNTYTLADFDGFAYVQNFPAIISDINVVALQAAADRAAIVAALANNGNLLIPQTQGRLDHISSTQVRLVQAGGSFLWIDGLNRPIPSAGVNLSNAGLTDATFYYVYAFMNGATMTLEASTTTHAANASGVRVKSGDATRTLVGCLYTDTGIVFTNTAPKRFVRSYYNRLQTPFSGTFGSGSTTSTTSTEINAALSAQCVAFSDDVIDLAFIGNATNATANHISQVGVDGATVGSQQTSSVSTGAVPVSPRTAFQRPDGLRTLSLRGYVSGGTGTWQGQILGSIG